MLTIFTVPKPFRGHVGDIQRNAIESWRGLRPDVQIVLVGDEEGVEAAAREAGVAHVGGLARNDRGTPRLDSAFERAAAVANWPLWCLVNADVVLLDDFPDAVERVAAAFPTFLMIGECRDLDVAAGARLREAAVRTQLRKRARDGGRLRGYAALDYFVFPRGIFDPVPPFLIGRACFDNWLVWRARDVRRPVVDATRSVVAVHQSHDYSHVPGGLEEAYYGDEARYNERVAGGRDHIFSLHDASHRLYPKGPPVPYWGSAFRAREKARVAKVRMDVRAAARRARKSAPHTVRILGVFPEPSAESTQLLDAIAERADVALTVLYAANPAAPEAGSTAPPQHQHWYPRSVQVPALDRVLGRAYPINWAILNSFQGLRPDCMIVAGWNTFATQSAIAWCAARRVPYLLLIDERDASSLAGLGSGRGLARAVLRGAAGVLVEGPAAQAPVLAHGVEGARVRELPTSAEAAAERLLDLARSAREERSRNGGRRASRFGPRLFRG